MNKQQLASKIWESANQMRSKIEANEYKDYILGFIFYKYLSDQEVKFALKEDFSEEDIKKFSEDDSDTMEYIRSNIGYFISYKDLFSTWISIGKDFNESNVRDALSAFSRLINPAHKKVFEGIFDTLQTGLSKLGDTAASRTKSISKLIELIKDIPMDGKQDYDVLGFIYEYLIGMFAANAGKKAGEFYTPHEVSILMSEIVADHLKNKKEIQIFDPTSGSGSLLINIGKSVAKHIDDENNIKYYAQEIKQNTYNLTRMNLVMRGLLADNIVTRNGDTLEDDWPYFEDNNPAKTYQPLYVDAVVSNPPYSQKWDPSHRETDPRFARFGLAPKSKADYAFLLHDLYHLKPDGIMTIVLPHGVLFRGGEEGAIRKNLIEGNHIDAIIGLPASIFFGTGIPTIIMVLKQKRKNTDVLIIDASKGYVKAGKNNMLRASDIKRIVDTVIDRQTVPNYSQAVGREEIRDNDYNLNIPRYVDSTEPVESWDIYASMFGGIPKNEIDRLDTYWNAFPGLREALFLKPAQHYCDVKVKDIKKAVKEHTAVKAFIHSFSAAFNNFGRYLKKELITNWNTVNLAKEETVLSKDIFKRLEQIPLIDKYEAYQLLDDDWNKVTVDLEVIQTEGFAVTKKVDPNLVLKKKDDKEQEVQEGWRGHVLPFDLVQEVLLKDELDALQANEARLLEIKSECEEIIETLSEDNDEFRVLNNANDAFAAKEVTKTLKEIYADIETEEIKGLNGYASLTKKADKLEFIKDYQEMDWSKMEANKDGTYAKTAVNKYIAELQSAFTFPDDSFENKIIRASGLLSEEKELKKQVKSESAALHLLTKETIENLSDKQVYELLEFKWITPLVTSLHKLPENIINKLAARVVALTEKYATTYKEVVEEIHETENALSAMIDELIGNEYDMKGLAEFQLLLKGE